MVISKTPKEVVILMAFLMSLVALAIDAMLPALPMMAEAYEIHDPNHIQKVVSYIFLGLGLGTLVFGPLSDQVGRKMSIQLGLITFCVGCIISIYATNFQVMLIGRLLQGFGAAAPRTVTVALVRDQFSGPEMANIMSLVIAVFILVPIVAPGLGQLVLYFGHWRNIFWLFFFVSIFSMFWLGFRQRETLPASARKPFSFAVLRSAFVEIMRSRVCLGYTMAASLISGAFVGYLGSSPQIFSDIYGIDDDFPYYFGALASSIGIASLINSRLVLFFGIHKLCKYALQAIAVIAVLYLGFLWLFPQNHVASIMVYFGLTFFFVGVLFGNLNAGAMEPMGHIAGKAAAVVSCFQSVFSGILGGWIGQSFDGSAKPLILGFLVLSLASLLCLPKRIEKEVSHVAV